MSGWPEAVHRSPARLIALTFALSVPFWLAGALIGRLSETLPVSALMACCPCWRRWRSCGVMSRAEPCTGCCGASWTGVPSPIPAGTASRSPCRWG
ncbi:hypothetical protein AAH991_38825 [Microbispora sp. ZYX-F-249]|uniref:MFS transporter n=1 Tax=Microbispora maris TaxID=3144104 RepID=A0ABV0B3I1_9ACTN